jgi:hypothetical protein
MKKVHAVDEKFRAILLFVCSAHSSFNLSTHTSRIEQRIAKKKNDNTKQH